ncbi:unnamed protein product [Mytilus edulis]|uniref:COR domain-containing protein n=1 Tax=Mytilus edulis TaxID=6550 RepID=A0A8S3TR43_MYTED|nr:unnamed protein product [Mytilus edulis]
MPEDLTSHVFSKSTVNTPSNLYALCELWDFAGQREFYATHQAFLTSSAVYLVVADMKDDIRKPELSQCFADFQHVGEYVEFWFDSIHCHRTDDERATNGYFHPPILLVFTGKDKYDKADFEKRQTELTYQIDQAFGFRSKFHHLHKKFYLSNLKDTDEEFENLRSEIYKTAKNMDNWGNLFPLKWVLLEHLIEINKNNGKNFINFTEMSKLAKHSDINILNADDLLLFLRFQHTVGNIIFFENIRDLIILNPQWLADAFRCLVSDRVDNSKLYHRCVVFRTKGFGSKCSGIYSKVKQLIEEIKEKYQVKISSKLHFKCSDGDYYKDTFEYDTLTNNQECFCPQHQTAHLSEQIYSPWMDNEVKEIPDRAKINTTQDDQNPGELYNVTM